MCCRLGKEVGQRARFDGLLPHDAAFEQLEAARVEFAMQRFEERGRFGSKNVGCAST